MNSQWFLMCFFFALKPCMNLWRTVCRVGRRCHLFGFCRSESPRVSVSNLRWHLRRHPAGDILAWAGKNNVRWETFGPFSEWDLWFLRSFVCIFQNHVISSPLLKDNLKLLYHCLVDDGCNLSHVTSASWINAKQRRWWWKGVYGRVGVPSGDRIHGLFVYIYLRWSHKNQSIVGRYII